MVKPMAPKIAAISSMVRLMGWIEPLGSGAGGSVTSIRSLARARGERHPVQHRLTVGEHVFHLFAEGIDGGAAGLSLVWGHLAKAAQEARDPPLLAHEGDAHGVERAGGRARRAMAASGVRLKGEEIVGHAKAPKIEKGCRQPAALSISHRDDAPVAGRPCQEAALGAASRTA